MFREMRRKNQTLPLEVCMEILNQRENGVLSVLGDGGYPYGVPLNHVWMDGKIYFHCAMEGHKIDAIRSCDKASYCVTDAEPVDPNHSSTRFRSVILFGRVRLLEDEAEKRRALIALGARYCPGRDASILAEINETVARTAIIELSIEHISGKESKTQARERRESNK